jgi:hypothetical protein
VDASASEPSYVEGNKFFARLQSELAAAELAPASITAAGEQPPGADCPKRSLISQD